MRLSLISLAITSALRSAAVSLAGVAPTLSSPALGSVTSTTGVPTVTTNKSGGTLYYAVLTDGGSASDAQIIAGSGGNIVAGKAGSQTVSAAGINTFTAVTGLSAETSYEIVFLQTDAESPVNTSAQATAGFATTAAALALTQVSATVAAGSPDSDIIITITGTTNNSVAAGVFGVEYGIGIDAGYVFTSIVSGVSGSPDTQLIVIGRDQGITQGDVVNLRAYVNEDPLDAIETRVYGNDIAPIVSSVSVGGNLVIGGQMVMSHGVIVGAYPMTRTYQWQRATGSPLDFVDVVEGSPPESPQFGAQERVYTVQAGDASYVLRGRVAVSNTAGSDNEDSAASGVVASAGPIAGYSKYWKFNTGITESGGMVDQWADQSGNGHHLTSSGTARPAVSAGIISFDGVDDELQSLFTAISQPLTLYLLVKMNGTPQILSSIFDSGTGAGDSTTWGYQNPATNTYLYAGAGESPVTDLFTTGAWLPVCCVFNGASSTIRVGAATTSAGNPGSNTLAGFLLGTNVSRSWFHFCDNLQVKEVLIYPSAHNSTQQDSNINYLGGL